MNHAVNRMNEIDGVVVRIEGDHAWVRTQGAGSACGACASRDGCSSSGEGTAAGKEKLLRLPNPIHAHAGDRVTIRAEAGAVWRAVRAAYLMPLLLAVGLAMVAARLTGDDAFAALGLLVGLLAGFAVLKIRGQACNSAGQVLSLGHPQKYVQFQERMDK